MRAELPPLKKVAWHQTAVVLEVCQEKTDLVSYQEVSSQAQKTLNNSLSPGFVCQSYCIDENVNELLTFNVCLDTIPEI